MDIKSWVDNEKTSALFTLRQGINMLGKFVDVGHANRTISPAQAKGLTYVRMQAKRRNWQWGHDLCDYVEDHQQTIGWPENSRVQLLKAIQWERWAEHDKNKGNISIATGETKH